jgi:hypothetical protein
MRNVLQKGNCESIDLMIVSLVQEEKTMKRQFIKNIIFSTMMILTSVRLFFK